ncbi:MAG: hypothetical protein DMG70_14245 [Acidobacteria bacterium]|nr:MAG: hypothetical protein DMG70_14245 [Acidobacteriota bacterium]PYY05463.1 MAG: hypothetical protein DMG69_26420 [Acidobacteriota bacterium]
MIATRIVLVVTLLVLAIALKVRAEGECAAATLAGTYGFSGNGLDTVRKAGSNTGFAPVVFVGTILFSGDGILSGSFTANGNGHIERGIPFTGAYIVNPDCTGSVAVIERNGYESHFEMTIANGGSEVLAIQTNSGKHRIFIVQKQ